MLMEPPMALELSSGVRSRRISTREMSAEEAPIISKFRSRLPVPRVAVEAEACGMPSKRISVLTASRPRTLTPTMLLAKYSTLTPGSHFMSSPGFESGIVPN